MPKNINRTTSVTQVTPSGTKKVSQLSVQVIGAGSADYLNKVRLGIPLKPLPYTLIREEKIFPVYKYEGWREVGSEVSLRNHAIKPNLHTGTAYDTLETSPDAMGYSRVEEGLESEAQCIAKAAAKFFDQARNSNSHVGTMVAEAKSTFTLIGDTAVRLARAFSFVKKGRITESFKVLYYNNPWLERHLKRRYDYEVRRYGKSDLKIKAQIRFASSAWLEMQYGWKPLLSDVYNAAGDLANRFSKNPNDIRIRGEHTSRGRVIIGRSAGSGIKPVPPWPNNERQSGSGVTERTVAYTCYARVIDQAARSRANLGLNDPLGIAWEMLPFSFVVDWFAPIGPFLSSISATSGLTFTSGCRTLFEKRVERIEIGGTGFTRTDGSFNHLIGVGFITVNRVRVVRTVINGFPSSSILLRIKTPKESFSWQHCANGLALLASAFR